MPAVELNCRSWEDPEDFKRRRRLGLGVFEKVCFCSVNKMAWMETLLFFKKKKKTAEVQMIVTIGIERRVVDLGGKLPRTWDQLDIVDEAERRLLGC